MEGVKEIRDKRAKESPPIKSMDEPPRQGKALVENGQKPLFLEFGSFKNAFWRLLNDHS